MKLSVRGEYALRALVALGNHFPSESVVPIQKISTEQKIPKRFLDQILNDLKSAGVVESRRGATGGYRLRRAPNQITLAEVIRHIEGPLAPVGCVSEKFYQKCTCPDELRCPIRSVMKEVRDGIVRILEHVTLADLCERAKKLEHQPLNPVDFMI